MYPTTIELDEGAGAKEEPYALPRRELAPLSAVEWPHREPGICRPSEAAETFAFLAVVPSLNLSPCIVGQSSTREPQFICRI